MSKDSQEFRADAKSLRRLADVLRCRPDQVEREVIALKELAERMLRENLGICE